MRALTALRWALFPALLGLMVALGAYLGLSGRPPSPYPSNIVSRIDLSLRAIAPLSAGAAALLTAQIAPFVESHRAARSWWAGALSAVWPAPVAALLAYVALQAWGLGRFASITPDSRATAMLLLGMLATVAWGLVGVAAGSLGRPLIAPVLAVAVHLFYAFPPALATMPWLRQLSGAQSGCCAPTQQPSLASMGVGLLVMAGLIASAWWAAPAPRWRWQRLTAGLAATLAGGCLLAALGPQRSSFSLVEARPDVTVCSGAAPEVCLWPEYSADRAHVAQVLGRAQRRLSAQGAPLLDGRISDYSASADPGDGADPTPGEGAPGLGYQPGANDAQIVANAAYSSLSHRAGAASCGGTTLQTSAAVLALIAGAAPAQLFGPSGIPPSVRTLRSRPLSQQIGSIESTVAKVRECAS